MTYLKALLYATVVSILALGPGYAQNAEKPLGDSVAVYYFHNNSRCVNCYNMEKWTKELMETCFKPQVDSGKLVFRIINTDEKENAHYLGDYKLYTKSVVLSLVKGGKEVRYDNLAKIWDFLKSKEKFQEYVKCEIEKDLKEL